VSKRILVVTTAPLRSENLRERLRNHPGSEGSEVRVVGPAVDISPLDWLTNDEGDARDEAADRALEAGRAVAPEAESVEAEVGDTDPTQAIEDALGTFTADELLLITHREDDSGWLEQGTAEEALERFNLPVTHVVVYED
jgi:hypothetical protein